LVINTLNMLIPAVLNY